MPPKESSFDAVSRVDLAEVDNAIANATREIANRYDLKGLPISILREEKALILAAPDDHKLDAAWDILQTHLVRRKVPLKNVAPLPPEDAAGGTRRRRYDLTVGLPQEAARAVAKAVKETGLKVRAEIRADEVRVVGRARDDLQAVIAALRAKDFGLELQFTNFRTQ